MGGFFELMTGMVSAHIPGPEKNMCIFNYGFWQYFFCIYEFTHVILRSVSLLSATRFFHAIIAGKGVKF